MRIPWQASLGTSSRPRSNAHPSERTLSNPNPSERNLSERNLSSPKPILRFVGALGLAVARRVQSAPLDGAEQRAGPPLRPRSSRSYGGNHGGGAPEDERVPVGFRVCADAGARLL